MASRHKNSGPKQFEVILRRYAEKLSPAELGKEIKKLQAQLKANHSGDVVTKLNIYKLVYQCRRDCGPRLRPIPVSSTSN